MKERTKAGVIVRIGICLLILILPLSAVAQTLTQNIRGVITDKASGIPMGYVTIQLENIPGKGAVSDSLGNFLLTQVPVGRHTVKASCIGYNPSLIREVLIISAKEVFLEIAMTENTQELQDIIIRPKVNKEQAINHMALTGARMFSVEEASRYAGGVDDPARLVSSFAGVSADGMSNGISIHGNAPHLLSWKMEGVEIPNPNHFADLSILGGGILSSLSAHVLGNSDFLTGAFPAEYSNAISGVFDVKLRNGNNLNYEHTAQVGTLGFDFASEGPISRKNGSSYLVNYRYSALGFAQQVGLIGMEDQNISYQDFNMKLSFPTRKAGTFSVWATGLIDDYVMGQTDKTKWESKEDELYAASKQYMAAGGVGHSYFFKGGGLLKTTLAGTFFKEHAATDTYAQDLTHIPYLDINRDLSNLLLDISHNRKFNSRFTNKTGINYTRMFYDMDMMMSPYFEEALLPVYKGNGSTGLIAAYSSTAFNVNDYVTFNFGLNGQWLTLNDSWTIEPRAGIRWQPSARTTFSVAYGLHSRMEKMDVYFVKVADRFVNKELDFTKAHHFMMSFAYKLSENVNFKIEPYCQFLYDVPVEVDGSYSVINRSDFYIDKALVNKGKGRNYGVDVTLERYLNRGWYYMLTGSLFNSTYCGGDGNWHDTKYNRNFIINALGGKEWMVGRNKQNVLSANVKLTFQGGDRYSPIDLDATMSHPDNEVQYDESRSFSKQFAPMFLASYTVSYKINKKKVSHEFAVKHINVTGAQSYHGHVYNYLTHQVEPNRATLAIPNILYKIEF